MIFNYRCLSNCLANFVNRKALKISNDTYYPPGIAQWLEHSAVAFASADVPNGKNEDRSADTEGFQVRLLVPGFFSMKKDFKKSEKFDNYSNTKKFL